ncbi:hypothetical protein OG897_24565 [Streptomyces sp. NBC_00237]|uniref:hypothetical protein n=1 Tax=Streptomyces sp. NBC_00237 TaxID=2975687 RepID=UPI00224D7EB3|nr:hypothetical protein [Streptomyces sp. NBC_00237]MCX5204616.1 hypothetical protein [Streptomyces sp. NBC_00237]
MKQDEWYGDSAGTGRDGSTAEVRATRSRSALALRVVLLSLLGVAALVAVGVILVSISFVASGNAQAP